MKNRSLHAQRFVPALSVLFVTTAFATSALAAEEVPALNSVVVTASRQQQRVNEVLADISVIDAEQIRAFGPSATINDVLARVPGVEINTKGGIGTDSSVFLRGSNTTHALVLVDGMRLGSATTGYPSWGFIPVEQIERIEVMRGPSSSLYGSDAIGGVIQIFTKRGEGPMRSFVELGYGSWNTSAMAVGLSGGQEGWRYSLQAAKKQSDSYSAINNPSNSSYNSDKDGFSNTSSSGSLSYAPSQGHEIGLNYMYSEGWNRYDSYPRNKDWRQDQSIYGLNFYSRNRLSQSWTSTLKVGQSADRSEQFADGTSSSLIQSEQTQYQWQNDLSLPIGTGLLALERTEQKVSGSVNYSLSNRTIDSMLAGWRGNIGNHRGQISIRHDNNSQFGSKDTGTIAYGYQITDAWRANASVASGFKAPSFNDMYWPGSGNPDLKPETSLNREVALHHESEQQHVSLTYYDNKVDNLIEWAPNTSGAWFPANVARAELSGWTLAYSAKIAEYRVTASVDAQKPEDIDRHTLLRYRAREIAKFGVVRNFGDYTVGGDVLASGKRYNDVSNTQVLNAYEIVNLHASYKMDRDWTVFARANNIFNRKYVLVQDYTTPGANCFIGVRYSPK
jgi:vitamin B12 transporter